jgi:hypothetical protein
LLQHLHMGDELDVDDAGTAAMTKQRRRVAESIRGAPPQRPPLRSPRVGGATKQRPLTELPTGWFALELFDMDEYSNTGGASGLFLDVKGSSKRRGTPLIVWPPGGGEDEAAATADNGTCGIPDNQLWRHDPVSGCLVSRIGHDSPKHAQLVMDVAGGEGTPGGKLITWTEVEDAPNQKVGVAAAEVVEPWTPVLPSMSAADSTMSALQVPDLEITTGRRVTPLGDPNMPPEVAALLVGTMLPGSLSSSLSSQGKRGSINSRASGRASGIKGDGGGGGGFRGVEVLKGHGGGQLVTLCLPDMQHQAEPLTIGVLQGVAAVVSRRASTAIARRASAGPVNAGGQVVTLGATKAKVGPSNGSGCIVKWRVVPAGSEGVLNGKSLECANAPPPPGFERPIRRGS